MPGGPEDVANAIFNGEVGTHLPAVLDKQVHRRGAPGRVRTPADFAVVGKQTQRGIGYVKPRAVYPVVLEFELPVCIVGRTGHRGRYVDLIVIVLSGALEDRAPLEHMGALDPGHRVAEEIDRARGVERQAAAVICVDSFPFKDNRRDLVVPDFCSREKVRIVDPVLGSLLVPCKLIGCKVYVDDIDRRRSVGLINQVVPYAPGPAQRGGPVRAVRGFGSADLEPLIQRAPERYPVLGVRHVVDLHQFLGVITSCGNRLIEVVR